MAIHKNIRSYPNRYLVVLNYLEVIMNFIYFFFVNTANSMNQKMLKKKLNAPKEVNWCKYMNKRKKMTKSKVYAFLNVYIPRTILKSSGKQLNYNYNSYIIVIQLHCYFKEHTCIYSFLF